MPRSTQTFDKRMSAPTKPMTTINTMATTEYSTVNNKPRRIVGNDCQMLLPILSPPRRATDRQCHCPSQRACGTSPHRTLRLGIDAATCRSTAREAALQDMAGSVSYCDILRRQHCLHHATLIIAEIFLKQLLIVAIVHDLGQPIIQCIDQFRFALG